MTQHFIKDIFPVTWPRPLPTNQETSLHLIGLMGEVTEASKMAQSNKKVEMNKMFEIYEITQMSEVSKTYKLVVMAAAKKIGKTK